MAALAVPSRLLLGARPSSAWWRALRRAPGRRRQLSFCCLAGAASFHARRPRRKQPMPNKVLCPKCHGQRTSACLGCHGTGKWTLAGITIGKCKECDGGGQRRCDVCGGSGEVEPPPPIGIAPASSSAVDEHQPSCFAGEEERGEGWKGSGATKPAINEAKSSL